MPTSKSISAVDFHGLSPRERRRPPNSGIAGQKFFRHSMPDFAGLGRYMFCGCPSRESGGAWRKTIARGDSHEYDG
jgi:hypothetical protein